MEFISYTSSHSFSNMYKSLMLNVLFIYCSSFLTFTFGINTLINQLSLSSHDALRIMAGLYSCSLSGRVRGWFQWSQSC